MATTHCFVLATLPCFSVLCVRAVWIEFCFLAACVCWLFMKDKLASFSYVVFFFSERKWALSLRPED